MTSGYTVTIKEMPETERPREKLLSEGPQILSNAELIGIILSSGTQNQTAIDLGKAVLCQSNEGLSFLRNCTIQELMEIKGIGLAKASQIIAAAELGKRLAITGRDSRYRIKCPEDISRLVMEDLRHLKKEVFNILLLNTKHEVISVEKISVGSLNASIVHPREVFQPAIRKSSSAIILVHNHPSGDPTPSKEDVNITKRLVESGDLLGISVLDHVIIGDNIYVSLREQESNIFV
ncbi:MAG: JAB domain-containing protein [Tindallia sp. MSAO_Bac2]|nr:MAG: JAB domain-containing protein [Tindallia sp. MSAO_Bac2]